MKLKIFGIAILAAICARADIAISPSSIDYAVGGGGAAVKTSGTGTWTATTDVDWITLVKTSGNAGVSCTYVVSRNNSADVREGHITISGNIYTVTQKGCPITLTPSSITADKVGTSGNITASVDAGVTWTATPSDSWITITPASGSGAAELSYTVAEYNVVGSRTGTIRIGSEKFTITQTGIDVTLSPVSTNVTKDVCIVPLQVVALTETKWTVTPNASWISVLDGGNGYGGSQVTLAVAENPSFEKRVGTVTIGTAVFTVSQSGTDDVNFKILPEVATASPKGAFANVAVYATPDASWSAESMDSWIKITEGESGAGNGNVKYVTMSNPELEPRTGHIKFTPPVYTPELDLYSGLLFWIKEQTNIEGNETRQTTYPLSREFDGSFYNQLTGTSIHALTNNGYALAFSFKVGELDRLNRLFKWGGNRCLYLDEDNVLCAGVAVWGGGWTIHKSSLVIDEANKWFSVVINQPIGKELTVYSGEKDSQLNLVCSYWDAVSAALGTDEIDMTAFKFGYGNCPSEGYLLSGQFANVRFWRRCLTNVECENVDTKQDVMLDINPSGLPDNCEYYYFPLNGNLFYDSSSAKGPQNGLAEQNGLSSTIGKNKIAHHAFSFDGTGTVALTNINNLFSGSYTRQPGAMYSKGSNSMQYYLYPCEPDCNEDATWNLWVKLDCLPSAGSEHCLLSREMCEFPTDGDNRAYAAPWYTVERFGSITNNFKFAVYVDSNGDLRIKQYSGKVQFYVDDDYSYYKICQDALIRNDLIPLNGKLSIGTWHMITLVGRARKNVLVYIDGKESGGCLTLMDFIYIPPLSIGAVYYDSNPGYWAGRVKEHSLNLTMGEMIGSVDDITILNTAISSKEALALYNGGLPVQDILHTVYQGIQEPAITPEEIAISKFGTTTNITLSVARTINWTATANDDWLSIVGETSGTGPATIMVKAEANPTCLPRTGTATIGTKTLTVHQDALNCTVSANKTIFPTEADETGGMGTIQVTPEANGSWTAESDVSWIYCYPESGTGSYDVYFFVEDMGSTAACRSGKITIGGQTIEITQRGYELSIDPQIAEVGGNAGAGVIGVAADEGALWSAIPDVSWISIVQTTDKVIRYTFTDNTTGETRIGHINIAGSTYTLTQTCKLDLNTSVEGQGTVTGGGKYAQGTTVSLAAIPANGYEFSHWSGDVVGVTTNTSVIMDTVKNVTATFIPESAAQVLAEKKSAQGGFYTRDQIHNLEVGNLVLDVDSTTGKARIGVQLQETSDLSNPDWKAVNVTSGDLDIGSDGTVGIKASASGNAKFFRVVTPSK